MKFATFIKIKTKSGAKSTITRAMGLNVQVRFHLVIPTSRPAHKDNRAVKSAIVLGVFDIFSRLIRQI